MVTLFMKTDLDAKAHKMFSKRTNSISIGADGYRRCPRLNDRLYGYEAEKSDRKKMFHMMGEIGMRKAN